MQFENIYVSDKVTKIEIGDTVTTSGLGTVYPYGIPIGTVTNISVNPYSRTKEAVITPFCDFSNIDEVVILTSYVRYTEGDHLPSGGDDN